MKIRVFRWLLLLNLALLMSFNLSAAEQGGFVQDVDYRRVNIKLIDTTNELDRLPQVADIEVFYWYGCDACRQVEQQLAPLIAANPHLLVRRTPLVAHVDWRAQAYLQAIEDQLKSTLSFPSHETLYQTCISDCSVLASFEAIKSWLALQTQVTELPRVNEIAVWQAEKDYRKRADSFSITQVPTIIIKESFAVDANSAKSAVRMQQIVEYLLNQDKP